MPNGIAQTKSQPSDLPGGISEEISKEDEEFFRQFAGFSPGESLGQVDREPAAEEALPPQEAAPSGDLTEEDIALFREFTGVAPGEEFREEASQLLPGQVAPGAEATFKERLVANLGTDVGDQRRILGKMGIETKVRGDNLFFRRPGESTFKRFDPDKSLFSFETFKDLFADLAGDAFEVALDVGGTALAAPALGPVGGVAAGAAAARAARRAAVASITGEFEAPGDELTEIAAAGAIGGAFAGATGLFTSSISKGTEAISKLKFKSRLKASIDEALPANQKAINELVQEADEFIRNNNVKIPDYIDESGNKAAGQLLLASDMVDDDQVIKAASSALTSAGGKKFTKAREEILIDVARSKLLKAAGAGVSESGFIKKTPSEFAENLGNILRRRQIMVGRAIKGVRDDAAKRFPNIRFKQENLLAFMRSKLEDARINIDTFGQIINEKDALTKIRLEYPQMKSKEAKNLLLGYRMIVENDRLGGIPLKEHSTIMKHLSSAFSGKAGRNNKSFMRQARFHSLFDEENAILQAADPALLNKFRQAKADYSLFTEEIDKLVMLAEKNRGEFATKVVELANRNDKFLDAIRVIAGEGSPTSQDDIMQELFSQYLVNNGFKELLEKKGADIDLSKLNQILFSGKHAGGIKMTPQILDQFLPKESQKAMKFVLARIEKFGEIQKRMETPSDLKTGQEVMRQIIVAIQTPFIALRATSIGKILGFGLRDRRMLELLEESARIAGKRAKSQQYKTAIDNLVSGARQGFEKAKPVAKVMLWAEKAAEKQVVSAVNGDYEGIQDKEIKLILKDLRNKKIVDEVLRQGQ